MVIIGGIFSGFFVIYKQFLAYLEKKDAATAKKDEDLKEITNRFITSNERSHEVFTRNHEALTALTTQVNIMNNNDTKVLKALDDNSIILTRAIGIIELHGKTDLVRAVADAKETKTS